MKAESYYSNRIKDLEGRLKIVQKKYNYLTFLRLIFFLLAGNSIFFLWGTFAMAPAFVVSFGLFLYVVHLSVDAKYQRDKVLTLLKINSNESAVLKGDWSMFEDGIEFRDGKHPFTFDMDVFGKKSVFQLLNRTVSIQGKNKLASTLSNGTSAIKTYNACIEELSSDLDWSQEFIAEGLVRKKEADNQGTLNSLTKVEIELPASMQFLKIILPVIAISATVLMTIELLPVAYFGVIIVLVMSPIGKNARKTSHMAQVLTFQSNRVKTILKQLELYHKLQPKNPLFKAEQEILLDQEKGVMAEIQTLDKIMKRFDFRMNFLMGFILNFFFAWDFRVLSQMKNWLEKNKGNLTQWEDKLAEIEVWISGAIFKFNNQDAVYAVINEASEAVEIKELRHPFVDIEKCIPNDVLLADKENFIIITGPNMAGKSTYLRSLGLTFMLANAGFPVLAKKCELPRLKLYSSMRTSDDLTEESSYFHAELIRLRFIMNAIERGEKIFIILDEILKGTNSKDKEIGSAKFLEKLKRLNSKGIIATHDLSLCNLSDQDAAFKNMCFDSIINGESLTFDYKIRQGVCQNMNASFLLKQMKLVD